jgi:hypothetical protein
MKERDGDTPFPSDEVGAYFPWSDDESPEALKAYITPSATSPII